MDTTFSVDKAKELLGSGMAQAQELVKDPSKIDDLLIQLEAKLKEIPKVGDMFANVPLMISMVKGYVTGSYSEVSPKVIVSLVAAALYLVKKKDLIPDAVPVIGMVDDIAVLTLALKLSEPELKAFAAFRDGTTVQRSYAADEKEYAPVKEGKVREIYDIGDALILVATDRISAFDVILKNQVTDKGKVLTQMSKFWFNLTSDILPNHMISTDTADMPAYFRTEAFEGRSMLCKKLTMLPIECIVRGYITGSGWASYQKTGTVCGITLPEGLKESEKLPEPIYTPSTKAEIGDHDENISFERSVEVLERDFPGHGQEYAETIRDATIALYKKCADYALSRGIIIADTKFEFGLDEFGRVVLADEMLTPDSSRFWPLNGYEAGKSQPSFDKQFVRDYLKAHPESDYDLPADVIEKTIAKYKEAYTLLTGQEI